MKLIDRFDKRAAAQEVTVVREWQCASCDRIIERDDTAPFCRDCACYWNDVGEGLFDHD